MKKVLFIGAGGYAKSALDSLDVAQYQFCGFIDSFKPVGSTHLGYPIIAADIAALENWEDYCYFISIGDNYHRADKFLRLQQLGCNIINIVDKTALVSKNAQFGRGVFIGKMAIVNSDVQVGDNVVVNTKALLEHGCRVGSHCNISTNTTLNGDVKVANYAFVGSSAVVNGQLLIGAYAIVGAGAVVVRDVAARTVVAGVPARLIRTIA